MFNRLRIKFVAVVMLVATILVVFFLSLLYFSTASMLEADNIEMMQSIDGFSSPDGFSPEVYSPDDRLHYFMLTETNQGELLVIDNTGFDLTDTNLLSELYHLAVQDEDGVGELKKYALRYYKSPTPHSTVYIFSDISEEYGSLRSLRNNCISIGVIALFILGLLVNILSRVIIHPVEQAWNNQKQFVADASHELKTPLTVIMTNMDMLKSSDYTVPQKAELVENISIMTDRMKSLVEGLLDLARIDSSTLKSAYSTINFSELVEQSLLPFEPVFFESGRILESNIFPHITLTGSANHLSQVTDILLDNALKYSYEGSIVRLTLRKQGKYALLCVDSIGDRISPDDLKNIFRRFYTVDKARTGDSYGLGLSIADAIIREHNGKIWAESTNGHNKFFVRLPL